MSWTLFLHKTHITMIQGYLLETLFIFRLPANMCLGIFVEIFLSASPGKQNISDQRTNSLILSHMSYTVHLERGSLSINQTIHLDLPALPIRLRPLWTTFESFFAFFFFWKQQQLETSSASAEQRIPRRLFLLLETFRFQDEADNEYENFSILSSVRARKTFWREKW